MTIKSRIGKRISECRKKLGMTIKELAEKTGSLSAARISNWEQGTRSPGPMEAKTLAQILEVAPSYLLCLTDNPSGDIHLHSTSAPRYAPLLALGQVHLDIRKQVSLEELASVISSTEKISIENKMKSLAGTHTFATTIEDTSMSPEFVPGDILLADPELKPKPGQYVIAHLKASKENVVRKYRETGTAKSTHLKHFELVALNPDWPNTSVQDKQEAAIIATVVEHRRILI